MYNQPVDTVTADGGVSLTEVDIKGEAFYRISHTERMRPFFMTIVSDSNHWLFVSSNGALSAGRKNAEYALFPYYTEDKITESAELTGSKTIIRLQEDGETLVWEPFSSRTEALFRYSRNVYKSRLGNKVIFEETNHDLSLTFRYEWNNSDRFGFVRKAGIINHAERERTIELLDGLQNILPYGVGSDLQLKTSNLADAYKRSELLPGCGLGIYALSAIIVDKAEPSEALKANTVWSAGIENPIYLLSSLQLAAFRKNGTIQQENDIKGEKGAYFVCSRITLAPGAEKKWLMVAEADQSQSTVIELSEQLINDKDLVSAVLSDIEAGTKRLLSLVASADGLQYSADERLDARHYSNVLFNIMRGGVFDDNYLLDKNDFCRFAGKANKSIFSQYQEFFSGLPEQLSVFSLKERAVQTGNPGLIRLSVEYLPLKFSRRHGDPSRPWNKFTINTKNPTDGSKVLDYEGNWRDIFQNWEALAHAFPGFIEGMIAKFLNASTFDGYNPYRVTKDGFDWETIEPDNPWSYIGYWGDHQVIYLLKFLEFARDHYPGLLDSLQESNHFVYAHVPYRLRTYEEIVRHPKDSILFDHKEDLSIRKRTEEMGSDGALLMNRHGGIHQVGFIEKILATLMAKLTNLVPGGGIWMNTQRPEWNDANNALVGNGLSMVTLYYLRRFMVFFNGLLRRSASHGFDLSVEMHEYVLAVHDILETLKNTELATMSDSRRKQIMDKLGEAASAYRTKIYDQRFEGTSSRMPAATITSIIETSLQLLDETIRLNKRPDGLYHAYNLLSVEEDKASLSHLEEMLEGQVAVLSSGLLTSTETVQLLDALRRSALYREDQDSYLLYPNKELPSFLRKNNIPASAIASVPILKGLMEKGGSGIIDKDVLGGFHFNGSFRNANDLDAALIKLSETDGSITEKDRQAAREVFEQVFNHKAFTGRSGTFFAYEGLGSIYWHMVSKLLLAVYETCERAFEENEDPTVQEALAQHFHDIREGIGVHKSPQTYGAFPTDPYSHTPLGKGAQQPGMTGQVKEDILCRIGELGVIVSNGRLQFRPFLLKNEQFNTSSRDIGFIDVRGNTHSISLEPGTIFFTCCQVPVIYELAQEMGLEIQSAGGKAWRPGVPELTEQESQAVFHRTGEISLIKVHVNLPV